jgi:hypothetical protein
VATFLWRAVSSVEGNKGRQLQLYMYKSKRIWGTESTLGDVESGLVQNSDIQGLRYGVDRFSMDAFHGHRRPLGGFRAAILLGCFYQIVEYGICGM